LRDAGDLFAVAAAIYVCYLGYGIIQEKIYSARYGPDNRRFDHSLFLVFVQCAVNALAAYAIMAFVKQPKNMVPLVDYLKISASYIGAMWCSNASLAFVTYPTQALAKSCKLVPVMLMRIVLLRTSYEIREYVNTFLTTIGISIFMLYQEAEEKRHVIGSSSSLGLLLLFLSLVADGYTGPRQEKLIELYKPTIYQMMLWMNIWSIGIVGAALIVTGQLFDAVRFCSEFPSAFNLMLIYSILSAFGQIAILVAVFRFNSLVLTTITTTRKFFTILASVVWFGHKINAIQWLGVFLVFLALGLNMYYSYLKKKKDKKADAPAKTD